jgi:hypothetical protein
MKKKWKVTIELYEEDDDADAFMEASDIQNEVQDLIESQTSLYVDSVSVEEVKTTQ